MEAIGSSYFDVMRVPVICVIRVRMIMVEMVRGGRGGSMGGRKVQEIGFVPTGTLFLSWDINLNIEKGVKTMRNFQHGA